MEDWADFPVILGQGSLYDLRDGDEPTPRLAGLRSVRNLQGGACMRKTAEPARRAIGFHIPKARA